MTWRIQLFLNIFKMIKEETLTVTIKKYTALDGTEYIAEGPSLGQANYAKSLCEHCNQMYDFLHFVVDENKLKKYNKIIC